MHQKHLLQLQYVLKEEYPAARTLVRPDGDRHWLLQLNVCSYAGVGRFVLGLFEDIEVLGDDGFLKYLDNRIRNLQTYIKQETI